MGLRLLLQQEINRKYISQPIFLTFHFQVPSEVDQTSALGIDR